MTAKGRFTQNEIERLLKGVRAAGLDPASIEIEISGKLTVTFGELSTEQELSLAAYAARTPNRRGNRHVWSDDDV